MAAVSAGLLVYRLAGKGKAEFLLVHPGGPWFARRDEGAWTIPKGAPERGEALLEAACREVREETGFTFAGPFRPLPTVRQSGGKLVHAWLVEGDADLAALTSNRFAMEWPPRSGRMREFPEVDRAAWLGSREARRRLMPAQHPLIEAAEAMIDASQAISRRSAEGSSRAR